MLKPHKACIYRACNFHHNHTLVYGPLLGNHVSQPIKEKMRKEEYIDLVNMLQPGSGSPMLTTINLQLNTVTVHCSQCTKSIQTNYHRELNRRYARVRRHLHICPHSPSPPPPYLHWGKIQIEELEHSERNERKEGLKSLKAKLRCLCRRNLAPLWFWSLKNKRVPP